MLSNSSFRLTAARLRFAVNPKGAVGRRHVTAHVTPSKQKLLRERGFREYQIGGYQVLAKWLKDRKKRILSSDDIKHYCRVVTALAKTIEIQAEIDLLYPGVEKDTINAAD